MHSPVHRPWHFLTLFDFMRRRTLNLQTHYLRALPAGCASHTRSAVVYNTYRAYSRRSCMRLPCHATSSRLSSPLVSAVRPWLVKSSQHGAALQLLSRLSGALARQTRQASCGSSACCVIASSHVLSDQERLLLCPVSSSW